MPASRLRECLTSLGGVGTNQIDYIEVVSGNTDYLDKVCQATSPGYTYDAIRTTEQSDECTTGGYMYPSHCFQGWLGGDCRNGCGNDNYNGFYCHQGNWLTNILVNTSLYF